MRKRRARPGAARRSPREGLSRLAQLPGFVPLAVARLLCSRPAGLNLQILHRFTSCLSGQRQPRVSDFKDPGIRLGPLG